MVRQSDSLMTASPPLEHWPLIIIGTGFAGLSLALQRMNDGQEDFIVLEQAQSPGGTWRDNR
jgi:cation diffusion facilitator CzcD-associated flavoprotein CzcO